MRERLRGRIPVEQSWDERRHWRMAHQRLTFALLARCVLRPAPLVLDRFQNARLLRFKDRRGRFELRDLGGHFLTSLGFPVAQRRAEDRIAGGLALPGVSHREQIMGNVTHQLVVAAHVGQALGRERKG